MEKDLETIKELHFLYKNGIITKEDFELKKNELLNIKQTKEESKVNSIQKEAPPSTEEVELQQPKADFTSEEPFITPTEPKVAKPKKKKSPKKNGLKKFVWIALILILLTIGGVGYWYYNYEKPIDNIGNTTLFKVYQNPVNNEYNAVPIAMYFNGTFIEPPYTLDYGEDIDSQEFISDEASANELVEQLKTTVEKGKFLYSTDNSTPEIITERLTFGFSDPSYISGGLTGRPDNDLLIDNTLIGTYNVKDLAENDRPELEKRFTDDNEPLKDSLIAKIDFDGDRIPELVYKCEAYEGEFFQIFSKAKDKWYLIYSGGYMGY